MVNMDLKLDFLEKMIVLLQNYQVQIKVGKDIDEYIIEEKELLKYLKQYRNNPISFSKRYSSGEKVHSYFNPVVDKGVFFILINKMEINIVGFIQM